MYSIQKKLTMIVDAITLIETRMVSIKKAEDLLLMNNQ